MQNTCNHDSPNTFQQRAQRMQETISRFVELYKSGRSEDQPWDINQPSTSSGVPITDRNHYIPGNVIRDAFMSMLLDQKYWPYLVQMSNAVLENYRYHGSMNENDILEAQNAVNMFDERIPECDIDSLSSGLDTLYTVFYWTPFNIYFGPKSSMTAPQIESDKIDTNLSPAIDVITINLSNFLCERFRKLDISMTTVKLYMALLLRRPVPETIETYREISRSIELYTQHVLKYKFNTELNTEEFNDLMTWVRKKSDTNSSINSDESEIEIVLKAWLIELDRIKACDNCKENGKKMLRIDPNCQDKKCPFSNPNIKYVLYPNDQPESFTVLIAPVVQLALFAGLHYVDKFIKAFVNHDDSGDIITSVVSAAIVAKNDLMGVLRRIIENSDLGEYSNFLLSSENVDQIFKRLKENQMEDE